MNIFDFRRKLVDDYAAYTRGFIRVREPRLRDFVNYQLDQGALWPEPLNEPETRQTGPGTAKKPQPGSRILPHPNSSGLRS